MKKGSILYIVIQQLIYSNTENNKGQCKHGGYRSTRHLTNSPCTNSPQGEVKSAHNNLGTWQTHHVLFESTRHSFIDNSPYLNGDLNYQIYCKKYIQKSWKYAIWKLSRLFIMKADFRCFEIVRVKQIVWLNWKKCLKCFYLFSVVFNYQKQKEFHSLITTHRLCYNMKNCTINPV